MATPTYFPCELPPLPAIGPAMCVTWAHVQSNLSDCQAPQSSSPGFLLGNRRFLTKRLWAAGSAPTHFHHGRLTSLREAVLAHSGEALAQRHAFEQLVSREQDAV